MSANPYHPGLPNYTGPEEGFFFCIHHDQLIEWSNSISKRLAYIDAHKPEHERATRRACITYCPEELLPEAVQRVDAEWRRVDAECQRVCAEWQRVCAEHAAELLAILDQLTPDHLWRDGALRFTP